MRGVEGEIIRVFRYKLDLKNRIPYTYTFGWDPKSYTPNPDNIVWEDDPRTSEIEEWVERNYDQRKKLAYIGETGKQ